MLGDIELVSCVGGDGIVLCENWRSKWEGQDWVEICL